MKKFKIGLHVTEGIEIGDIVKNGIDGTEHELIKHHDSDDCINCSLDAICKDDHFCRHIPDTHFKQINP